MIKINEPTMKVIYNRNQNDIKEMFQSVSIDAKDIFSLKAKEICDRHGFPYSQIEADDVERFDAYVEKILVPIYKLKNRIIDRYRENKCDFEKEATLIYFIYHFEGCTELESGVWCELKNNVDRHYQEKGLPLISKDMRTLIDEVYDKPSKGHYNTIQNKMLLNQISMRRKEEARKIAIAKSRVEQRYIEEID